MDEDNEKVESDLRVIGFLKENQQDNQENKEDK